MSHIPQFVRLFLLLCVLPFAAVAQTITLDNTIQTYATLASTTVTMTGRAELRISGAGTPITGCTIHLNSPDAWLFFSALRPSAVNAAGISGQIRVSGAAAAVNTNCRIVEYGDGTVVIPHAANFAPLTVFSGSHFTGTSMALTNYSAYDNVTLGLLNDQITSFKLKRGYTATIAQNPAGTGASKNYVAADGDIEVALLPATLDNSVSFVRVFPWRWTAKKGIAGNIEGDVNARWGYNWNIDRNSSLDWEYVPIKHQRYWPSLNQNWQTRGANHLLGYNEPDHVDQANMSVATAISAWPELLGTGLRVGSPAPTDGGRSSWLYPFMNQADAAALRVDFVAVHYYQCRNPTDPAGAATQMYNFLLDVYNNTGRPIWITEWNNGAGWTGCADPTFAQQEAAVDAMMDMLESTPFVERYSFYSWVEEVRQISYNAGGLTPAGVTYRDKASRIGYQQVIPEVPTLGGALYRFENDARDASQYGHSAITKGAATFAAGKTGQGITMSGGAASADHVQLAPELGDSDDFTFSAWVYWTGGGNWQRIFDLGADANNYMFLSPKAGSGFMRFAIKNGGSEQQLNHTAALQTNAWTHIAVTINGSTGKLFVNGAVVATNASMSINPSALGTTENYLGKSRFSADPFFAGKLDDVQFLPFALPDAKVMNTPPVFASTAVSGGNHIVGTAFSATLAATDADAGDVVTHTKLAGPAWLSIAANGALSGTPTLAEEGTQIFAIQAADSTGATAVATYSLTLSVSGTWSADAAGTWSDATKWTSAFPAHGSGKTANFSTLNITADRTVTLDGARAIGDLRFGDTSGAQNWTLAGSTLTLREEPEIIPVILVNQNTATITAPLTGTSFVKSGAGTLVLGAATSVAGPLYVDTGSTSASDGTLRLAHPNAGGGVPEIHIRNNNSGSSTLALDGTAGAVTRSADVFLAGRAGTVAAIRNIAGSNVLSGPLTINSGGANYIFQSDAGSLTLSGGITSAATATRTLTFQGAGSFVVSGVVENGSATTGVAMTKTGTGTLTLSAANTHTGPTNVNAGTVVVNGTTTASAITVASGATLGGSGTLGNVVVNSGATIAPGANGVGTLSASAATLSGTLAIEVASAASADRLNASGAVTLSGPLSIAAPAGLPVGTTFTILNKTSAGAISGMFTARPQSSVFSVSGNSWLISYTGGDGNDATLTIPTAQQAWRFANFGTIASVGNGADNFDANADGELNLMEFATGQSSAANTRTVPAMATSGGNLEFTYTRANAALADGVTFVVEWNDALPSGAWSSVGVTEQILSDNGTVQSVKATFPAGSGSRFARLRVVK